MSIQQTRRLCLNIPLAGRVDMHIQTAIRGMLILTEQNKIESIVDWVTWMRIDSFNISNTKNFDEILKTMNNLRHFLNIILSNKIILSHLKYK